MWQFYNSYFFHLFTVNNLVNLLLVLKNVSLSLHFHNENIISCCKYYIKSFVISFLFIRYLKEQHKLTETNWNKLFNNLWPTTGQEANHCYHCISDGKKKSKLWKITTNPRNLVPVMQHILTECYKNICHLLCNVVWFKAGNPCVQDVQIKVVHF